MTYMLEKINLSEELGVSSFPSNINSEKVSALLWARETMQEHISTTYSVRDPEGIEELQAVKIGGVDQWLHIRGRNRDNPILLYLHGGPGFGMIGCMDAVQRPWEDYFTVVHWDQRQTGKSYYPADDEKQPLTINQFVSDTEEVIEYVLTQLKKEKASHFWPVLGVNPWDACYEKKSSVVTCVHRRWSGSKLDRK